MSQSGRQFPDLFVQQLTSLSGLRSLECTAVPDYGTTPDGQSIALMLCKTVLNAPLASALPLLTGLTLCPCSQLPLDMLSKQLTLLLGLQCLRVRELHVSSTEAFRQCFAPLTALTFLQLWMLPVTAETTQAFVSVVNGMSELASGQIWIADAHNSEASDDWYKGLSGLPARGCYEFWVTDNEYEGDAGAASMRQILISRGATFVKTDLSYVSFLPLSDTDV